MQRICRQKIDYKGFVPRLEQQSTIPVHRLCLVLQLNAIEVNGTELQYHIQPVDSCGAVILILYNPSILPLKQQGPCVTATVALPDHDIFFGYHEVVVLLRETPRWGRECYSPGNAPWGKRYAN